MLRAVLAPKKMLKHHCTVELRHQRVEDVIESTGAALRMRKLSRDTLLAKHVCFAFKENTTNNLFHSIASQERHRV